MEFFFGARFNFTARLNLFGPCAGILAGVSIYRRAELDIFIMAQFFIVFRFVREIRFVYPT